MVTVTYVIMAWPSCGNGNCNWMLTVDRPDFVMKEYGMENS